MDKKPLIVVSICAVVLLVLASLSNVVGYQQVQSSNQKTLNEVIDQKELVFQTILDFANNKEIQGILLREQISRGNFPGTSIPVLTMKQLRQMYLVGLILSKTISTAKMHSMIEKYQENNLLMEKEINAVIEKDATLNKEMKQLSYSECNCETENPTPWIPIICLLFAPLIPLAIILYFFLNFDFLLHVLGIIDSMFNCPW